MTSAHRRSPAAVGGLALVRPPAAATAVTTPAPPRRRPRSPATAATGTAPGTGSRRRRLHLRRPKDDFGYNQAAYEGSQAVKAAYPDLEVITAENVPETDKAARVMEGMIDKGAKIIFATSYGHLDAALKVAADHPDVVVVQQGNIITGAVPAERRHLLRHRVRAGLPGRHRGREDDDQSNKLGYVYAFPIPQTIANINAFQLGAKSVNPDGQDVHRQHVELVRPGQAGRRRQEPARPGRRRASPSTRTARRP